MSPDHDVYGLHKLDLELTLIQWLSVQANAGNVQFEITQTCEIKSNVPGQLIEIETSHYRFGWGCNQALHSVK